MSTRGERQQAAELDRRILAAIRDAQVDWHLSEARLDTLALEVFAYQCEHLPAYRRFAAARGAEPGRIDSWRRVPPIPARVFKNLRYAAFEPAATRRTFRSSGTGGGRRAVLELDTLELYDASLLANLTRHLFPDGARMPWIALLPDPGRTTDSSLAYMVGRAAVELASDVRYLVGDGRLDLDATLDALEQAAGGGRPVCLLGTAFAFVHLLDRLDADGHRIALPAGSRIMETGGFKGRSRVVERPDLYRGLSAGLGVPVAAIVGEYGMTEMGSQFYDDTLRRWWQAGAGGGGGDAGRSVAGAPGAADRASLMDPAATRLKRAPPWVRTRVVDPLTLEPAADGDGGMLAHLDLTGRGAALCLVTEDVGRRRGDAFELLGRSTGAELRGCSLPYEELLGDGALP